MEEVKLKLTEKIESHVVIRLLFGFFLLFFFFNFFFCWGCSSGGSRGCSSGRHASQLFTSGCNGFGDVLSFEVFQHNVELLVIDVDSDASKNLLDIISSWVFIATHSSQDVRSNVTHFLSLFDTKRSQ